MLCINTLEQTRAGRIFLVLMLTLLWWACAVAVTVYIKAVVGPPAAPGPFPYPLTLTLWANVGTAIATGAVAFAHMCVVNLGSDLSRSSVLRVTSREALLCEDPTSRQDSTDSEADCFGTSGGEPAARKQVGLFQGCCGRHRRRHSSDGAAPLEQDPQVAEGRLASSSPRREGGENSSAGLRAPEQTQVAGSWWRRQLKTALSGSRLHIILIGLLLGLGSGVKNEALKFLSLSMRTMIMATNVLVVMVIASLFGLESLNKLKLVSAFLLAAGGMLQGVATWAGTPSKEPKSVMAVPDDPFGYALAVLALLLDALRWVLLQAVIVTEEKAVSSENTSSSAAPEAGVASVPTAGAEGKPVSGQAAAPPKLSKFAMVSWVMWNSCPILLCLCVVFEPAGLLQAVQHPLVLIALVSPLTMGFIGINIAEFGVVQWTSAVTFNVLSQLHSIPMVLAGFFWFDEDVVLVQILGFSVCLLGAVIYSFARAGEQQRPSEEDEGGRQ